MLQMEPPGAHRKWRTYLRSEVGGLVRQAPPVTGKSFRVLPCVRTCVRAVLGLVRFQRNRRTCSFPFPLCPGRPFPFPFCPAGFSLFPCASICSLFPCEHHEEMDSNEIKWIHMKSNEITWYQMKSRETKWTKVKSNEINWTQMTSSEFEWNQLNSTEINWNQMNSKETKWIQVTSDESEWHPVKSNWVPPPIPPILLSNFSWLYRYVNIMDKLCIVKNIC